MSESIKVSEVSDILRKQLEGIDTHIQLDETGTVLQVSDGVARIYGLRNAPGRSARADSRRFSGKRG